MSLPSDLQRFAPIAVAAVLAVVGLFVVSKGIGGGSSGGGGNSAQQVIEKAFSAPAQSRGGGRIAGQVTIEVAGPEAAAAGLSQPFSMSIDGFANQPRAGRAPSFDIGVKTEAGGERHALRLISTGKQGFIDLDGRAYELPAGQLKQLSSAQGSNSDDSAALKALGVDPRTWIKNPADAGTAQVGGEPTDHVVAEIDVPQMLADVTKAAERSGQARQVQEIPAEARAAIRKAVKNAQLEVFASQKDGSLRRVVATAGFEAPGPQGEKLGGDVRFDLQVTEVGKTQKVVAPRNAQPFSALDPGSFGLDQLGTLGTGSSSSPSNSQPEPAQPAGGSSKQRSQSRKAAAQAYVACVQQALDVGALVKCQKLLP